MAKEEDIEKVEQILLTLSPLEKQVIPLLKLGNVEKIEEEAKLNATSVKRALQFLESKGLVSLSSKKSKVIKIDVNGILYLRKGLPERRLLSLLVENKIISLEDAKKQSGLTDNEFTAGLGALKEKNFVEVKTGKLHLRASKEDATLKFPEERFLETLPLDPERLSPEQQACFDKLKTRKALVKIDEVSELEFEITELGRVVIKKLPKLKQELVEQLTPEMLRKGTWKGKQFRHYVLETKVPAIIGGRRQFYYEFLQETREKLVQLGFEEMTGPLIVNEFWNFDALFQPQFHPAREWTDNYKVANELKAQIPSKKILTAVKTEHEKKWFYRWDREKAMQFILRPQGTVLSALRLGSGKVNVPGKYFAIARCFRPDVIDASHLIEFNQLEGIIVGKELNFRHLLNLLKMFAEEIVGAKASDIKFLPDYYPFTEPSIELDIKKDGKWIEIGGAGIFRDEVVWPLMPKAKEQNIRVLAWGLGIDRLAMLRFGINDIRELFSKKLEFLRTIKCQQ